MLKQFRALSCLGASCWLRRPPRRRPSPLKQILFMWTSSGCATRMARFFVPSIPRRRVFPRIATRPHGVPNPRYPMDMRSVNFPALLSGNMQYRFSTTRTRTANSTATSWGSPARVWALRITPKGIFGPPKFDAAAFQFAGGRVDLKITIAYL